VDEAVNKVRAEVDPEAELIIGAITDPQLDGKMRVSIVATSLDGQQPESKSVINMVHRIQNRNPGYSDFSNLGLNNQMELNNNQNHFTEGATALKLEDEVQVNNEVGLTETQHSSVVNDSLDHVVTNEVQEEFVSHNHNTENHEINEKEPSNGLENFGLQEEGSFELFEENNGSQESFVQDEKETEEDELEIPAFLRRQKN